MTTSARLLTIFALSLPLLAGAAQQDPVAQAASAPAASVPAAPVPAPAANAPVLAPNSPTAQETTVGGGAANRPAPEYTDRPRAGMPAPAAGEHRPCPLPMTTPRPTLERW